MSHRRRGGDANVNRLIITSAVPIDDQFSSPKQIRWSAALGKLLVANSSTVPAQVRNFDLSFYSKFSYNSNYVGIDSDTNNIYGGRSSGTFHIDKFSLSFSILSSSLSIPNLRMIDASGDPDYVYVTSNNDTDGHGVRKIRKSDMTVVASLLSTGSGDGQFNNPLGVKYYDGFVYICDYTNLRVVKLNASDLSFVANYQPLATVYFDLDTDGTNWYFAVGDYIMKCDMNLANPIYSAQNNSGQYSLCIIPDQSDGYGTTLAIVDNTNNHLERRKCSDLSVINSVGSAGDGSASLFDPTFTTSVATRITYQFDDGFSHVTPLGTSHALSWNGFAGYSFRSAGPHKCTVKVAGGVGLVTTIDASSDACNLIKNINKSYSLLNFYITSNPTLSLDLSSMPRTVRQIYTGGCSAIRGKIADCPPDATHFIASTCPLITGSVADLAASVRIAYLYNNTIITTGSIAHLVVFQDLRIYNMGLNSTGVDTVLLSASDAVWADANHYTYSAPSLRIDSNAVPGGSVGADTTAPSVTPGNGNSNSDWQWDAVLGAHKALTGKAAIYYLTHLATHTWSIQYQV